MECLPQTIDGAVDDAAIEAEQETADRGDATDQDNEARILCAARGDAGGERDAVHAGSLMRELNSPHIAAFSRTGETQCTTPLHVVSCC